MDETSFTPIGPMPAVAGAIPSLAEMEPSFGEYVGAQFASSLRDNGYAAGMAGIVELNEANRTRPRSGFGPLHPASDETFNPMPGPEKTMSAEDVGLLAAEQGVDLPNLGGSRYTLDAATIMLDRAKRRQVNDQTIAAYDPSWGTAAAVSLMAGLADPLNIASAFIPFVGEARYAELLAGATGLMGRTAVRAGAGAVEGFGGAALLEPILIEAATQEGRDYQMADGMRNLLFGAAFGAGLHTSLGGIADVAFKRRFTVDPITDPVDLVDRLPVEVNQAAISAAISDLVHGRPVQAAEVVDGFVRTNPDLAEAISYAATLRRDGPELDNIPGRIAYWEEQLEAMKTPPKRALDFMTWLRSKGGLRDLDNDIRDRVGDTKHLGKAYISQKGAAKTDRGADFDTLYNEAKAEGFVTSREEFRSMFEKDARGRFRQSDQAVLKARESQAAHIQRMLTEAGVNPKTKNAIKARAIAGREQHIVAAERARLRAAFERLQARQDDYKTIAEGGKAEVVRDYEPPKAEKPKAGETVEPGDEVLTLDDKGQPNLDAPLKVSRVIDDPLYGTHVYFEGVSSGYPANQLQIVKKSAGEAKAGDAPKAEPLTQPVDAEGKPRPYTFDEVVVAIAEAKALTRGGPVSFEALGERLPGLTKSTMTRVAKELMKSGDVKNIGGDGHGNYIMDFMQRKSDDEHVQGASQTEKLEQARRNLDKLYPKMGGEQRTYYLASIFPGQREQLDIKDTSIASQLNLLIGQKKLKAIDEETGLELTFLDTAYFHINTRDNMPGVLLTFADTTKPSPRPPLPPSRLPKAKGEAPVVKAADATREPMPPGTEVRVDTPPAPKEALTVAELETARAQTREVQEVTLRRIESMMGQLPPDVAESLRAQLAKIDGDTAELEKVMNSAVSCLLNPR